MKRFLFATTITLFAAPALAEESPPAAAPEADAAAPAAPEDPPVAPDGGETTSSDEPPSSSDGDDAAEPSEDDEARPSEDDAGKGSGGEATTTGTTIALTGEDDELTQAVAAELRAAGYEVLVLAPGSSVDVSAEDAPVLVSVRQEGELVLVEATVVDEVVDATVAPAEQDGMPDRDAVALRAAETIRMLVSSAPEETSPEEAPAAPEAKPKKAPSSSPTVTVNVGSDEVRPDAVIPERKGIVINVGAHGGIAALGYRNGFDTQVTTRAWGLGANVGVDLGREFDLRGTLTFYRGAEDDPFNDGDVWAVRAGGGVDWPFLGQDNLISPLIGGGVYGEYLRAENFAEVALNEPSPFGDEPSFETVSFEERLVNGGLTAHVGVTAGRSFRVRFDVVGSLQLFSFGGENDDQRPIPSAMAMLGFEWDALDFRRRTPSPTTVAARR
ncbi:MAG: hypothetical protein AAGN82_05830 [Myxococcota bacterium]